MRISKTSGRSSVKAPKKPARATAASKSRSKSRKAETASAQALNHTPAPSQLTGLKLALQRLAAGVDQLPARPLSGSTAQAALQGLRE